MRHHASFHSFCPRSVSLRTLPALPFSLDFTLPTPPLPTAAPTQGPEMPCALCNHSALAHTEKLCTVMCAAGSPDPKILEAMKAEHCDFGAESTDTFVTGNYGIETTSQAEWAFVVESDATPEQFNLARWPEETEEKLPERDKCRKKRPLANLLKGPERKTCDERLKKINQPGTMDEELIAIIQYT